MQKNVLIVDDTSVFRRLLRSHLEEKGFMVSEASDGQEALEHLQSCTPENDRGFGGPPYPFAIVLDVLMPVMDGYTFIQRLRRTLPDPLRGTPVICLTSRTKMRDLFEMEGVKGFVEKTAEGIEELMQLLDNI